MNSPSVVSKAAPGGDRPVAKARRFGIGVGIEGRARKGLVSRPESGAAHFVRIGFARDGVGQSGHAARMGRRGPSGEPGHREIEAAPEEMDRARLADKAAAEELEDAIRLHERAPEAMGGGCVISGVDPVLRKADRIRNFVRRLLDRDRNAHAVEKIEGRAIEIGDRLRPQAAGTVRRLGWFAR